MNIYLHELSGKIGLFSRERADEIVDLIETGKVDDDTPIVVDFSKVVAFTPGFFDQLLWGLEAKFRPDAGALTLSLRNAPTEASSKFATIGRRHGLALEEVAEGEWLLAPPSSR